MCVVCVRDRAATERPSDALCHPPPLGHSGTSTHRLHILVPPVLHRATVRLAQQRQLGAPAQNASECVCRSLRAGRVPCMVGAGALCARGDRQVVPPGPASSRGRPPSRAAGRSMGARSRRRERTSLCAPIAPGRRAVPAARAARRRQGARPIRGGRTVRAASQGPPAWCGNVLW